MKNVVLLSIDSLRFDAIAYNRSNYLGYSKPNLETPTLDKFALDGTSFRYTYSTNSFTTASHASMFTGEYPPKHLIRGFFDFHQQLNKDTPTTAEDLSKLGYKSFFYSDIKELFSEMNIWRGFNFKTYSRINWLWNTLEDNVGKNNFIFIHLFDVHEPYMLIKDKTNIKTSVGLFSKNFLSICKKVNFKPKSNPKLKPFDSWRELKTHLSLENISVRETLAPLYYLGVERFDKFGLPIIFNKLDKLGINTDNSLIMITSDHGEGATHIGDRSSFHHSGEITEEVIRIPFLINKKIVIHNDPLISTTNYRDLILNYCNQMDSKISRKIFSNKSVYAEYVEIDKRGFRLVDGDNRLVDEYRNMVVEKMMRQRAYLAINRKIILNSNNSLDSKSPIYLRKAITYDTTNFTSENFVSELPLFCALLIFWLSSKKIYQ